VKLGKKRLLIGASAISGFSAGAMLLAGTTFGFFSAATNPQSNSFTAGTVTLSTPVSVPCTITNLVPGDQTSGYTPANPNQTNAAVAQCTFSVNYTGSVPAFIGLDLATSGTGLYDSTSNGLQFQIKDNNGGTYATGGVLNGGSNLFVASDPGGTTAHSFTVDYALPSSAPNSYQGLNTTLTLTVHAVQAANNGSASGCTAGHVCAGIHNWS
jgi:hypothetical protein